ncbi:MAG: lipB [Myxococcaceae bacterium]|nr:lipB [Myxococcaceae bacterium]
MSTTVYRLGRVEYPDGLDLQTQLQRARMAGQVGDTLLLLEHPPVLTLGRAAKAANILTPAEQLQRLGVAVFETDRGGDVTYHGPGQIVGYPLLHLVPGKQDVRKYVRGIEEVLIVALQHFGIAAVRMPQWPGVWLAQSRLGGPRKIAALGVHLSRWYTRHGFALNVSPNLAHFELIVPCGIREAGVTSMEAELGRQVPIAEVEAVLVQAFGQVFETPMEPAQPGLRTVSVVVHRDQRILALQRTEARGGFWQPVTGRIEAGESPEAAAQRELAEETGLTAPVRPLDYVHAFAQRETQPPRLIEETAFSAEAPAGFVPRLDPAEHRAFEWVEREEAIARFPYEGLKEAVRRAAPR